MDWSVFRIISSGVLFALLIAGCGESSSGDTTPDDPADMGMPAVTDSGTPDTDTGSPAEDSGTSDAASDMPEPGEWVQISPGGETICSRGTPFSFFVRGGRPDRVIVDFRGGGACWNDLTCSIAGSIFAEAVDNFEQLKGFAESGLLGGVFDISEDSLFKDWTLVHIPYCTGDVHWGDAVHEYSNENVIHHKGYVNASAALAWLYERILQPSNVLVSGCSAGAYGAIMHSAYIAHHYTDARIAVLADSGAGIITDTFLNDSLPNWGAQQNIPPFIEALQRPLAEMELPDLYKAVGQHFPQHRYAQTSTAFDADQIFYLEAMGGDRHTWSPRFRDSLNRIEDVTPNFRAYVPPGSVHCVTPYTYYRDRVVNGVKLSDWMRDFIFADEIPDSVKCDGEDCYNDPVCDACAVDGGIWCGFCRGWPDAFRPPMADDSEMPDGETPDGGMPDGEMPDGGMPDSE